ncbi:putative ABC transporter permease [Lacrimispora sp. NSJ-141]|uniref:ABC transporter permease n=1 Tax=Lientehia hominis TaxID=2897778 RepID=A0AAP2RHA7_9FIRM|nr:putative ABC transporter permease [Lientehia hominis]MCD2491404.1 putative ABC transporter permease [Lientehia hominis]
MSLEEDSMGGVEKREEASVQAARIVLLLFLYSVMGWIVEVVFMFFLYGEYCERGFLYGPYCPIYGFGLIGLGVLLKRCLNKPVRFILLSMAVCGVLEFLTGAVLEAVFHTVWWDYSMFLFHIGGRVCLETLIPFGILSYLFLRFIHPKIAGMVERIPLRLLYALSTGIVLVIIIDFIATVRRWM